MSESVLIERTGEADDELRMTAVSDVPLEGAQRDVPPTGSVLDERYEITGLLGQGGMGHVLSARHVVLGHRVAIKVLRREMTRDAEIVERFRREARAASAIGHTGIVAVKDFGALPSGASYYVMEHVDGISLADALQEEQRFSVDRAVDVVRQIADALGAAHAAGVVHRDVKPENVLLTSFHGRPDHVKVLDFGIAKLDFASRLSGAHRVLGTPAYMSPEQAKGQTLDQRTDVYALGILFYELLVGDVPFDDARPLEVLRQQIQMTPPSVKDARPDVPDALAALIARCLEKSPDARPASMKALYDALAPFAPVRSASFVGSSPSPPARPMPMPLRESLVSGIAISAGVPVASRATPVALTPPRSRTVPIALVLGIALTLVGFVALAAAGGILAREHEDETTATLVAPATSTPASVAAPIAAPPPVAPVSVASAPPPLPAPVPPPSITPPPAHPAHAAAHGHVPLAAPVSEAAAVPAPAAPAPAEHPAIRVIDPWDNP